MDDTLYADGFEDCIIGVFTESEVPRIVYDKWAMVEVLMESDQAMTWDDAVEYLQYNVWGAYVGKGTPIYLRTFHGTTEERIMEIDEYVDELRE